jgi:hypothetical protein
VLISPVRFVEPSEPELAAVICATLCFISADLESPKTDFDGVSPLVGVPGLTPSVGFVPPVVPSFDGVVVSFVPPVVVSFVPPVVVSFVPPVPIVPIIVFLV